MTRKDLLQQTDRHSGKSLQKKKLYESWNKKTFNKKEHICKNEGVCSTSSQASTYSRIWKKRTWMAASEKEAVQQRLQEDYIFFLGPVQIIWIFGVLQTSQKGFICFRNNITNQNKFQKYSLFFLLFFQQHLSV